MTPFFLLIGSWILLRVAGMLGVRRLGTWDQAGAWALPLVFVFTGATHFSPMAADYVAMLPPPLPRSVWLIYLTGALEMAGAVGLTMPSVRRQAGLGLIGLLVAMFPANVYAATTGVPFAGQPPTPLGIRALIQGAFIVALWFVALRSRPSAQS